MGEKIKTIIFKVFGLRYVGPENTTDASLVHNRFFNSAVQKMLGVRIVRGYAQCGEDLILESFFPNKTDGFFVDIGANHPIRASNTYLLYKKGWRGINIEPDPSRMRLFKIFRKKDINLNIGIGQKKSELTFYVFKTNTLSTFDKISADKYQKMGYTLKKTIKVPVLSLTEIFETYASRKEIDFISIDTEGYDMEVLKSNDWKKYRPHFVILETAEVTNDGTKKRTNLIFDPYMREIGYHVKMSTEVNTIYEKNN